MGVAAVCPGTFDPVTFGHLDIIERASGRFGDLVVAVLVNPSKHPVFTLEERVSMLKEATSGLDGVEVDSFDGLLVDYAARRGIGVIVKGLRAVSDFDYEFQMAQMNYRLTGIETFFMSTNPKWSYISSSLIKDVARLGGDVGGLVPDFVEERLTDKLNQSEREGD